MATAQECLAIAQKTLAAMNDFSKRIDSLLRFPPHQELPNKEANPRETGAISKQNMPKVPMTEQDMENSVAKGPLRFVDSKRKRVVPPQYNDWEIGKFEPQEESATSNAVKKEWRIFAERVRLRTAKTSKELSQQKQEETSNIQNVNTINIQVGINKYINSNSNRHN